MAKTDEEIDLTVVAEKLERLSRLLRQQGFQGGLNPVQWEALRYVARANRFSNSPGALALYLGSTKGTVSQSLLSLLKKGLIRKAPDVRDLRNMVLTLTDEGGVLLRQDPLLQMQTDLGGLGEKTARRFAKGLTEILGETIKRHGIREFGTCQTCRHWRDRSGGDKNSTCMLFDALLVVEETKKLCQHSLAR